MDFSFDGKILEITYCGNSVVTLLTDLSFVSVGREWREKGEQGGVVEEKEGMWVEL